MPFYDRLLHAGLARLAPKPRLDGALHLTGLSAPAEVLRDAWGVPHIYAESLLDLLRAQGYIHAQERLWQMEFNRRLVAGRTAELLGARAIPLDRWMRTLTMRRVAEYEATQLNEANRQRLQAYCDGVNAFIAAGPLPIEFTLLRARPEPWILADSLGWVKMMAWSLSVNWETELLRLRLVQALGPELAADLEPPDDGRGPYAIPPGVDLSRLGESALQAAAAARPFSGPSPYDGLGSNNWVIHGGRTASGKPLLANDMHLGLSIPAIWFENHLSGGGLELAGISFPGLPGIVAGHNGRVAWGFTNGFPDVQDLYIERLRPAPGGGWQAEYNGAWEAVQSWKETIQVKDAAPVEHEVVVTRHGPVINNLSPELSGEQPLALRWTALDPDQIMSAMFAMLHSGSCQEFHQALRDWTTPAQNVVYADSAGNIAYTLPGRIPIRKAGDGRLPVPGWTDEYEWTGYIPFDALPHLLNPEQGFIATANYYPLNDGSGGVHGYTQDLAIEPVSKDRILRIHELLSAAPEPIDTAYIRRMHFDQLSPLAREAAAALGSLHSEDPRLAQALARLRQWDGSLRPESPEAAVIQVFYRKLLALLLADRLDPPAVLPEPGEGPSGLRLKRGDLAERYRGKGPTPVLMEGSLFGHHSLDFLRRLFSLGESPWFDLGRGETRQQTLLRALQESLDELAALLGPDPNGWQWRQLHALKLNHLLGSVPALGGFFNRGPFPIGGDCTTIWNTGANQYDLGGELIVGPPYRMIVDLADPDASQSILLPGQSGSPASPHYADQIQAWFEGGYHPMLFTRPAVQAGAIHRLELKP